MDKIIIKDLEIFANHGVYSAEQELGQKFLVSAELLTDTRAAGLSDDLTESVHYGEVSLLIKKIMEENTFKLIERAAEEIALGILTSFSNVNALKLTIKKPWAPVRLPLDTVAVEIERAWHTAYIAIGSNMGDSKGYLDMAVKELNKSTGCIVKKVADYIVTKPYGGVEQEDFLNSALELKTVLPPVELLDLLHKIEGMANRERKVHWGPRTLDLDIIMYDDLIFENDDLIIPHVDMEKRDFVLKPMCQLAPNKRHPIFRKTMTQLFQELK